MIFTQIIFLELLKSGIWNTDIDISPFKDEVDWNHISRLSREQTVVGLVTDGIVKLPKELRPSASSLFNMISQVRTIEDSNMYMNKAAVHIINRLEGNGCHTLLLKGQGVATNYLNPKHRMPGDIDLFVGFDNSLNDKANDIMRHIASNIGHNDIKRKHAEYHVGKALVEIHGEIGTCVNKQCDNLVEEWAKKRLSEECRIIALEEGKMKVPPYNFDALYIFLHFATHYMNGGVGLRQISDWMMYIHKNYDCIDKELLERDIDFLNVREIWKTFAAMAVDFLGYPKEKMPLYDSRYGNRGRVLLGHIFKTGNFGAKQKKWQLSNKHNAVLKKIITFSGQIPVYMDNIRLFPKDTLYCFGRFVKGGLNSL